MLDHKDYCPAYYGHAACDCKTSDEALAELRKALAGDSEQEITYPATLTVYTANGNVTVENVREDSISITGGVLKCEEDNNTSSIRIFHFVNVLGYSTVIA